MKKLFTILALCLFVFASCSDDDDNTFSTSSFVIEGSENGYVIKEGQVITIDPKLTLDTDDKVLWKNNNQTLSTEPKLTFKGEKAGDYKINLTIINQPAWTIKTAEFTITVQPYDINYVRLNLSDFNLTDGVETKVKDGKIWKGTFDPKSTTFASGIFTFSHVVNASEWGNYSYGFTVSNSKDNANHGDAFYSTNEFGSITKGGVDGEGKPFAISYISGYDEKNIPYKGKFEIGEVFAESNYSSWVKISHNTTSYKIISASITNSSLTYYITLNGNSQSAKIKEGDYTILKIYGVDKNNKLTKPIDFYLSDYRSENEKDRFVLNTWKTVDLTSLGEIKYLVFNIDSNIKNEYGITVPTYFCLDKLTVEKMN